MFRLLAISFMCVNFLKINSANQEIKTVKQFPSQGVIAESRENEQNYLYQCPEVENGALAYMNVGHKYFEEKLFHYAVYYYGEAKMMLPDNFDIYENLAESYGALGYFYRALDKAHYIFEKDPSCFQAVFYKAKYLIGLQKYQEAKRFLKEHMYFNEKFQKSKHFSLLLAKLYKLEYQQKTGNYDFVKLFLNGRMDDYADYVGPVKIKKIPGKGRGIIATEDIKAGQLLILNKAFSISYQTNIRDKKWLGYDELVNLIAEKITVEPEHAPLLYKSYAGPEMQYMENAGNDSYDYRRIQGVCSYTSTIVGDKGNLKKRGLWLLPAYINHNGFDSNSFWVIYDDIMVVRALKNISKGKEILTSYVDFTDSFEQREFECKKHGFECSCRVCQADRSDTEEIRNERQLILQQISKSTDKPKLLRALVERLERLRPKNPELNVYIVAPLGILGAHYYSTGEYNKAAFYFKKAHKIMTNSTFVSNAMDCSTFILNSYISMGNSKDKEIRKWLEILKEDIIVAHGSTEIFKAVAHDTLHALERLGITF